MFSVCLLFRDTAALNWDLAPPGTRLWAFPQDSAIKGRECRALQHSQKHRFYHFLSKKWQPDSTYSKCGGWDEHSQQILPKVARSPPSTKMSWWAYSFLTDLLALKLPAFEDGYCRSFQPNECSMLAGFGLQHSTKCWFCGGTCQTYASPLRTWVEPPKNEESSIWAGFPNWFP